MESAETPIAYAAGMSGLRLDLIIRTSKRKKEAKSPKQQRDIAETCAQAHGHEIVFVHDSGTDESGKTMNRASIHAAQARLRAGLTDGIILALADRIGRAPIEEAMPVVRMFATEGKLVLADMGGVPLDLTNGVNETNVVMQLQFARQYWLTTANRFQRSQRDAIKAGKWIGRAPIGFAKVTAGADKGKLVPGKYAAEMTETYRVAATDGIEKAVAYFERATGRATNTADLRRLLKSKVYLGEIHYKGYAPNLSAHKPLVTFSIYTNAQTESRGQRASGDYPLSHQVECGKCGAGMVGWLQSVPYKGKITTYRRMRCSECKGNPINADKLEAHVRGTLAALLASDAFRDEFSPSGLREAESALHAAEEDRRALRVKVRPSHPDFDQWLAEADADVNEKQRAFRAASASVHQAKTLPGADELDDPEQFARGLRAIRRFHDIVIDAANGTRDITGRVRLVRHERDDMAGALAA